MNSKLGFLLVFLFLAACGETEQIGDKLNAQEIAYLRERAKTQCLSDTNPEFADIISSSNSSMVDFDRDQEEWDYKYSSSGKTHKIHVWKTTASAVYFHIVTSETTAPKHIFLKYSTASNTALMRQVQTDGCEQTTYTSSVNSSSVTMKKDDPAFTNFSTTAKYKVFRTWNFNSTQPGFFGFMQHTYKKQYYDLKGNTVTSPAAESDTYTVTLDTTPTAQSSTIYTSADYPSRYYCLVTDYTTKLIDVVNAGTGSSGLTCQNMDDTTTVTVGTESFDPDTELGPPFN